MESSWKERQAKATITMEKSNNELRSIIKSNWFAIAVYALAAGWVFCCAHRAATKRPTLASESGKCYQVIGLSMHEKKLNGFLFDLVLLLGGFFCLAHFHVCMDLICLFGRCLYYVRLNNKVLFFKSKYYRIMHVVFVFFHQLGLFAVNYDSTYTYPDYSPPPPHWYSTTIVAAEPRKTFAWSPLICIFDFTMLNTISSYQHILGTKTFTAECLCVCLQVLRAGTKWNAFLGRNAHRLIGHQCAHRKTL